MPEAFYLVPMTIGPYSRTNPQGPMYVDEIQCNWVGHPVEELGYYVCKVNTTDVKHANLASRANVRQLPRGYTLDTILSTLPAPARNAISNWCNQRGIPYDAAETMGQFLMRVVNSGLFSLGATALNTPYSALNSTQQNKITELCAKWNIALPASNETVRQISNRCGVVFWNPAGVGVAEY